MRNGVLDSFANWLAGTPISKMIVESQWTWPVSETLHFVGLALLIGTVSLVDLRMLGLVRGVRLSGAHRLIRWGIFGFIINLITGGLFFVGAPGQYIHNTVFHLKLIFMLLAGVNALVFELAIFPGVRTLGADEDAPVSAKCVAAISLCLWVGVMFLGRMLPFMGEAF